jgi:DNA-binding NtrC family response regulator
MLSASDVEQDALRAGVNAFLRKPQDIGRLSATVMRLLTKDTTSKSLNRERVKGEARDFR